VHQISSKSDECPSELLISDKVNYSTASAFTLSSNIDSRISFKLSTITFKALGSGRPSYLASLLHDYSPPRTMRSSSAKLLTAPRHNLSLGSRAFRISAPTTWNSLPQYDRECSSLASFRNHLKTHYFSSALSALWHLIHMRFDSNLTTRFINHLLTYLFTYFCNIRRYEHDRESDFQARCVILIVIEERTNDISTVDISM